MLRVTVHHLATLTKGIGVQDDEWRPYKEGRLHRRARILYIPLAMGVITQGERGAITRKGADGKGELPTQGGYPVEVLPFRRPELHSIEAGPLGKSKAVIKLHVSAKHLNVC